MNNFRSDNFRD